MSTFFGPKSHQLMFFLEQIQNTYTVVPYIKALNNLQKIIKICDKL